MRRGLAVLLMLLLTGHLAFGDPKDKEFKAQQKRIADMQEKLLKEKLRDLELDRLRKTFEQAPKDPRRRELFFESFPLKKIDTDLLKRISERWTKPGGGLFLSDVKSLNNRLIARYARIQYVRDCIKLGKDFEALEVQKELGFK